ncbi:MAG: hypothetical protein ACE5JE_00275 [Thermoplasmata archaeon]
MTFDEVKEFKGRKYTGMAVGGYHTWIYPNALWRERKVSPDAWEFTLSAIKERETQAPKGSGAPLNTQYHWYILAHQRVRKVDSNTYSTLMTGTKYKLAHKRAGQDRWNSESGWGPSKEERLATILETALAQVKDVSRRRRVVSLADF